MRRGIGLMVLGLIAWWHSPPAGAATPDRVQVTGEIIDTWCYVTEIMYALGTAHHQCAVWCAVGGIPVSILGDDGKMYMVLKVEHEETNVASPRVVKIQTHKVTVDEWGIEHEQKARFEAKVVDILCELTGDCPANCGDGKRQFGLLKDDGTLIPAVKNFDAFAGTVNDLQPFCGQRIMADGLLIDDPVMKVFTLQFKKPVDGDWARANSFTRDWSDAHSGNAAQWFRHDPMVEELIETQGVFGIPGLEPSE